MTTRLFDIFLIPILPLNDGPISTVSVPHKMMEGNSSGKSMMQELITEMQPSFTKNLLLPN